MLAHGHHHRHREPHPLEHPGGDGHDPAPRPSAPADRGVEVGLRRGRVDGLLDRRQHQAPLVREDPEDRALGDAGGPGELAGADVPALLDEERHEHVEDRLAAVLGGHGGGAGGHRTSPSE